MPNPRTKARLEARIHERAAYCLQFELRDPRAGFVTVTRVELSDDLTSGRIHYSVLGDEADRSKVEHMLQSAAGFIQRQVARVLTLRRMPHLRWVYDDSFENADHIDQLIRDARTRDKEIHPDMDEEPAVEPAGLDAGERVELDDDAEDPDDLEDDAEDTDDLDDPDDLDEELDEPDDGPGGARRADA